MENCALFVRIKAKPGKESEVQVLLKELVSAESQDSHITAGLSFKKSSQEFALFDIFANESARNAYLEHLKTKGLFARYSELLVAEPQVEKMELLSERLPGVERNPRELPPEAYAP